MDRKSNCELILRIATLNDVEQLVKLRINYLQEQGNVENGDALRDKLNTYFEKTLREKTFVGIIAEKNNQICATAFCSIAERPPRRANQSSKVGTIYNVYTYPQYRRQGIATTVLKRLCVEVEKQDISVLDLCASEQGKILYEKLGFEIPKYTYMRRIME